jgi:hypothetical protein
MFASSSASSSPDTAADGPPSGVLVRHEGLKGMLTGAIKG